MAVPGIGILDMPQYDWRDAVANLVKAAVGGYAAPSTGAPTIYSPSSGAGPAVAAQRGNGPGHFVTPDYEQLIQGDPGYQGVAASAAAARSSAAQQRANAIRRALVQFGMTPSRYQSRYGDVDAATAAAAAANPNSTMRKLQDIRSRGSADLAAALGARGILSSGALTGGEQVLQRNYDTTSQDATQNLLDALGGYESGYANTEQSLEAQRAAAYGDAGNRVASLYPATWVSDAPPYVPGNPITYQDLGIDTSGQTIFGGQGGIGGSIDVPYSPDVGGVIQDVLPSLTPPISSGPPIRYTPPPVVKPPVIKSSLPFRNAYNFSNKRG